MTILKKQNLLMELLPSLKQSQDKRAVESQASNRSKLLQANSPPFLKVCISTPTITLYAIKILSPSSIVLLITCNPIPISTYLWKAIVMKEDLKHIIFRSVRAEPIVYARFSSKKESIRNAFTSSLMEKNAPLI